MYIYIHIYIYICICIISLSLSLSLHQVIRPLCGGRFERWERRRVTMLHITVTQEMNLLVWYSLVLIVQTAFAPLTLICPEAPRRFVRGTFECVFVLLRAILFAIFFLHHPQAQLLIPTVSSNHKHSLCKNPPAARTSRSTCVTFLC